MMKKFICRSAAFCTIMAVLLAGTAALVLFAIPPQFGQTYQHALERQYESLQRVRSPKVVVLGDSSVPFSLNARMMEKILKMPVQTLGIHSGTGLKYILRLSESNIRSGDILIVELVPFKDGDFSPGVALTACENDFSMYRYFSAPEWREVVAYYPAYLLKKVKYAAGIRDSQMPSYSERSFDANGNYAYARKGCTLSRPLPRAERETAFRESDYTEGTLSFLNRYIDDCQRKGARVLITFPPFLDESLESSPAEIDGLQAYLSGRLHAPVITKIRNRALPRRYIYNNITHCNTAGADKVTTDLAHEIQNYLKSSPAKGQTLNPNGDRRQGSAPHGLIPSGMR